MATATQKHAILKTYHGPSMAEALAEVKRDLGTEAVILHTRTYKVGGVLGVGTRDMVEITASSDASVVRPRRIRPRAATTETGGFDRGLGMPASQTPQVPLSTPQSAHPVFTSKVLKDAGETGFIPTPPWFQPKKAENPEPPMLGRRVESGAVDDSGVGVSPAKPKIPAREPAQVVEAKHHPPAAVLPADSKPQPAPRLSATRVSPAPTTPTAHAALEDELAVIRRLVGQVLQSSRRAEARVAHPTEPGLASAPSVSTGPIFDLYMRLLDNQTSTEVADELTSAIRDDLTAGELTDTAVVRDAMLRHIAKRIAVTSDTQPPTRTQADRPTVVALIGPTGVGKTTTVAKLAATYKLRYGRRVGLVTADTYRIAAVEQLRTYADIVGLPLKVALSPQDMTAAIEALSDCDVVLVDTAGRSQHDAARLDELNEFLEAAQPDTTHLVLSLAAAESVIYAAADRFGALKPRSLILSKLDEAVDFGVIANIAARVGVPISHITTGQEVPDHIEPANADRLARLVLDGQAAFAVSTRGV